MTDGSIRLEQLLLLDADKLSATDDKGTVRVYSPDDVSTFVMGTDSFTVLRNFYVTLTQDAEIYKSSFMRVCAAGVGLELYEFKGMMNRTQLDGGSAALFAAGIALRAVAGNTAIPGGLNSEQTPMLTTAWLLRREGNPRWLTLPSGARNLREVIEPLISDDAELSATVRWGSLRPKDVPALLSQYVARKTH